MAVAYLAAGSNVGNRQAHIDKALSLLKESKDIEVLSVSGWVETEPEGGPPGQGKYLNGALKIRTALSPLELLGRLKVIERRCGRVSHEPNAPRPMDLDILLYDDVVIVDGKTLSIPHPRFDRRRFVLEPLAQIAPDAFHPRLRKTVRELLDALPREAVPNGAGA